MSERVKEIDPSLYAVIAKHIALAPDPRPSSVVATYEEKWTTVTAWGRLLHELEALSIEEDDATILEDIQNVNLGDRKHLRELLTSFRANYPMIWWALGYTSPKGILHAKVALGEVRSDDPSLSARTITLSMISYVRDLSTAQLLRRIKGPVKQIRETADAISDQVKKRHLGKLYWILASIEPTYESKLKKAFDDVIRYDEDEEFLMPFMELAQENLSNAPNLLDVVAKPWTEPPSRIFPRFLRGVWDQYLLLRSTPGRSDTSPIINFISQIWQHPTTFLDEDFAEYMVRTYLKHIDTNKLPYERTLHFFTLPQYANVWPLVIDYLSDECRLDPSPVGTVSRHAHDIGLEKIALVYKEAFLTYFHTDDRVKAISSLRHYDRCIEYVFNDLSYEDQLRLLLSADYVTLPPSSYDAAITQEEDATIQRKIAREFLLRSVFYANLDTQTLDISLLRRILTYLTMEDVISVLNTSHYNPKSFSLLQSLLSHEPSLTRPDNVMLSYWTYWKDRQLQDDREEIIKLLMHPSYVLPDRFIVKELEKGHLPVLDVLPARQVRRLATSNDLGKLSLSTALAVAKITQIPLEVILGDNLYSRLKKVTTNWMTWESVAEFTSAQADWSRIFSLYISSKTSITKVALTVMMAKGADPSYRSSYILLHIMTFYRTKEAVEMLRLVGTPKALAKLSPGMREEVKKLLESPSK